METAAKLVTGHMAMAALATFVSHPEAAASMVKAVSHVSTQAIRANTWRNDPRVETIWRTESRMWTLPGYHDAGDFTRPKEARELYFMTPTPGPWLPTLSATALQFGGYR